jgi:hypothetical protein
MMPRMNKAEKLKVAKLLCHDAALLAVLPTDRRRERVILYYLQCALGLLSGELDPC